jgi:signal peptidase I
VFRFRECNGLGSYKIDFMTVSNPSARNLAKEALHKSGRVRMLVSGASMVPTLRPGDLITVESARAGEIRPGEMVVFALSGRLVVHRVIAKTGDPREPLLATRGDRARRDDPVVSSVELFGRVTQIERGNRRVRPRNRLTPAERLVCRLLRVSDRAASLYLRVSAL